MKNKYPLLNQLRADYQRKEKEIQAPVIKIVNEERRAKEIAIKKYEEIEFKFGQDIIKMAMDQAKNNIARNISEQFAKYMYDVGAYDEEGDFIFKISKQYARMAMPDRITQDALNEYANWSRPRLAITDNPSKYTQTIQIKIPALDINVVLDKWPH